MLIHVSLHPVALKGVVPTNYPATIEPMANCCTRRQRPSGRRATECSQQLPPSDGDRHTPLPREGAQRTISCREYAVIAVRALLTELCLDTQSDSQKVPADISSRRSEIAALCSQCW